MTAKVKISSYWTPWEHEVCSECYKSNPYSIWLVKLRCFHPHRHQPCTFTRVVLDHEHMTMQPIRRLPKSFNMYWFRGPYKFCLNRDNCPKRTRCLYAHSQSEIDMWNIKIRLHREHNNLIVGLSNASLQSQCPSEVCRLCFEANPKALWLAWLKCTNLEKHQNKDKVVVIATSGVSQRLLVKVRPLPAGIEELSQVERCPNSIYVRGGRLCDFDSCCRAHTKEELLYWQWEVAKQIFKKDSCFRQLCSKYEYPEENSAIINSVLREHLVTENYKSKYHKLVYLEKMENSRKIITECDSESVQLILEMSRFGRDYNVYLMDLSYTAMDYASHTRADVVITLAQSGRQYTAQVFDTPDFDKNALILRIPPQSSFFQLCNPPNRLKYQFEVSAHFEISQQYYQRMHKAIDYVGDDLLAKLIPSNARASRSRSYVASRKNSNNKIGGFSLDKTYQVEALNNILSCNPSVPYLLLGPFGTGKTYLLAATVAKLVKAGGNLVLVCTHLNRGADGLYRSLQEKVKDIEGHVARVVGSTESVNNLRLYDGASVVDLQLNSDSVYNFSVLVTTFGVALGMADLVKGMQFTHILIDEGAQCPEPEALGALVLASATTRVIIVGDNKQVGPQVRVLSEKARNNGLGESLLERIYSCYKTTNDSLTSSTLLTNYRCHPSILMLASSLFYECTLISESRREAHPKAPYPLMFACTSLKRDNFRNCQPENEEEAKLLITKMLEYIESWPTPPTEPIGLLASTKQQVACLRKQWRSMKRNQNLRGVQVEIVPTYNIQGEEFSAVFLSTSEPTDAKGAPADRIKSICNEYVFNTVITRAQSLIFVAGNPFFLLHMGSHYRINCWTEYIRRCIQSQSFIPPANVSLSNAESLPRIIGQICEKVLLSGSIQQLEDEELDFDAIDLIMERYISDLNKRREYKLATKLIQTPSGDISWILEDAEAPTENGILWCKLDCKNFREAVANPLDSNEEPIKLSSASISGRRGTFHEGIVKVDTIHKRVLFDEETETALSSTYFGASFPCRVDPKNPILFFPLDHRYPKFVNLPMLLVHTCKGVVCFDPKSINSTPKVSNFIPLEVAAKMLFVVKFLGWQKKYPYPLGIIIAALPPGHSCYTGELALRISNNIPLGPCSMKNVMEMQMAEEGHVSSHIRYCFSGAFTIDPKGSADHDDALTCRLVCTTDKGNEYEIGVHIIDVQSCIPKDSELDEKARKRGCSSYRSPDHCISSMLPEEMVQSKLSIAEGESRNTLSVIGRYLIGKQGSIEEVPNSVMFKESKVHCTLGLTYEEAQQILFREPSYSVQNKIASYNEDHVSIENQLGWLWKIALFIRQNRLGKDAAYSFTLDEPEKQKCPEAHYLVEELMIWANSHVALKLLKTFPEQTILRVQTKPPDSELMNLRKNHGQAMAISLGLRSYVLAGQVPVDQIQILRSICTQIRDYLSKKMCRNALHYVQFEHLHPQIAVATVGLRQTRKACGTGYIVSSSGTKEYWHDTLQCAQYTHFTSPIRRYIDIVVQRLLYAAICRRVCPYSKKELAEVCELVKKAVKNSNNYDRDVKRLDLASSLESVSREYVSFVQRITEDAEVELTFADPHLKVLYARERLIALKHLNALAIPSIQGREVSPEPTLNINSSMLSSDISITESVTWQVKIAYFKGTAQNFFSNRQFATPAVNVDGHSQKRCADIGHFVPEGNILSEHSNLDEHKIVLSVVPYTRSMSQAIWTELQNICKLDLSTDQDKKRLAEILLKTFQSEASNPPPVPVCYSPLLIYKLSRPIQISEVFQVQMTTSTRNSVLSPSVQLIEVGPELRVCIQHNNSPAECFADRLVEDASKRRYTSIGDYFRCWEQVLLSEAASESLSESELLIVKDVTLNWPKLDCECDSFGQVLFKLNVPPGKKDGGVVMKLPSDFLKMSFEFFKFDIGDLLCIRYDVEQEERKFGFVFHMVIHHAEIEKKERTNIIESATFYLKFVGPSSNSISPEIAKLLTLPTVGVTLKCEIQLLPLTLPFRRIYSCLHDLRLEENISPLAKQVALGTAKTANLNSSPSLQNSGFLTHEELSTATSLWPFQKRGCGRRKKLNGFQKKALDIACSNTFTLIQGPPGTGKSITGAHMAYTLAKKLRKERSCSSMPLRPAASGVVIEELKPCVMYCGPSNQAVNVVLDILIQHNIPVKDELKILRVFSKTIEQGKYPGPKLHEQVFRKYSSGNDSKCECRHEPFALHELVRKANHRITELESEFIQLHRKGKIPSQATRQEYYRILTGTERSVLKDNVDIVLCTCNEASSMRIRTTLKPVYCIVDECGMATEPECMVPIQRADHVILIGDHRQLRPVIKNHNAEVKGLGTSLFERYVSADKYAQIQEPHMLEVQYRMHPELCKFPSREFYNGKLKTDGAMIPCRRNIPAAHLRNFWPQGEGMPLVFVDLVGREGGEHTGQRGKTKVGLESKFNKDEARKIADIAFVLVMQHHVAPNQIAVLTPYSAQKDEIKKCLPKKDLKLSNVHVKTVTESQGSEYGIVLLSTVRSKPLQEIRVGGDSSEEKKNADIGWIMKNLGFVRDSHQICVGITRCKYGLVIVGNKTLLSYSDVWSRLIKHYRDNDCIVSARNFPRT